MASRESLPPKNNHRIDGTAFILRRNMINAVKNKQNTALARKDILRRNIFRDSSITFDAAASRYSNAHPRGGWRPLEGRRRASAAIRVVPPECEKEGIFPARQEKAGAEHLPR
jgi:hypothetical protein